MKKLLLLIVLFSAYANAQNSYIFLKDGTKIPVEDDFGVFRLHRETKLDYWIIKESGRPSIKTIDIKKVDRVETLNGATYVPYENERGTKGLYKTLIKSKDKKLIICFRSGGDFEQFTSVSYAILDANGKEIVFAYFSLREPEKYEVMLDEIRKHFRDCPEVQQSLARCKGIEPKYEPLEKSKAPTGFMFQTKVFECN